MTDAQYTLADLFCIDADRLTSERREDLGTKGGLDELARKSTRGPRRLHRDVLLNMVLDKTKSVLDIPVSTILVRGWMRWQEVKDQLQRAVFRRDKSVVIPLCEHKLVSTHKPHIDVYRGEQLVHSIKLKIDLAIEVEGAALKVENALITEIQTGQCKVTGSVELEGCEIAKEESQPLELPGRIRFEPGIEIARLAGPTVVVTPDVEAFVA